MSERNGYGSITLNVILSLFTLGVAGWVASNNSRIVALEEFKSGIAMDVTTTKWDVKRSREDICRVEGKIDDLTEWVTKRRVFRTPCP